MPSLGIKLFLPGDTLPAEELNGYLMNQVVAVYNTPAARDSAYGDGVPVSTGGSGKPALSLGMLCFVKFESDGTTPRNTIQFYDGSAWQDSEQFVVSDGTITTAKLAANSVTSDKIAPGTVIAADIAAGTITETEIANSAVASAKIANDAVTTVKIADANVTTAKIADSNITTEKIADANVTTVKIADANVTTVKIADANVTTAKIADEAVTSAKIADGTIVNADISANAAIEIGKIADATINTKTANYSLVLTDKNKFIKMNSSSSRTITVPLQATVDFPEGAQIHLVRYGSGTLEIVGESNAVNIYATPGKFLRARYSSATLLKCADTNAWLLIGDLSES